MNKADENREGGKPWTKRQVIAVICVFFGILFAVNGVFITLAVTSFTGEDVPRSYQQGIAYNETIEARRTQKTLGWHVVMNDYEGDDGKTVIVAKFDDKEGRGISGLNITGNLRHPSDKHLDHFLTFDDEGYGRYKAVIDVPDGHWQLRASATRDGSPPFRFEQEIWVK